MPTRVLLAPLRYVQGPDALQQLGEQLQVFRIKNPLVVAPPEVREKIGSTITESLKSRGLSFAFIEFGGECTWKEIERIKNACIKGSHDAIVNCGGGKTLDAGRCAASGPATNVEKEPPEVFPKFGAGVPCINVPTIAATDASTSAASLIYSERGTVEATMIFPTNPTMVLVDTWVIAKSPVRLLVSGMGDALATYFEADMCHRTASPSLQTNALSTRTARVLGRLCFDLLMEHGVQAKAEAEAGLAGPGIEAIVEANVLLSGLGFESGGLSASHAVGQAFHYIRERFRQHLFHGELVGFGTLTQLVMEGREPQFLDRIFGFCKAVGLPTTFEEMGLEGVTDAELEKVALAASRDILIRSFVGAREIRD
ncbi:MAG TPA: glycerol dehydrogenase, partial [Syntrophorhabdales bacterium]|nr:glycerol dehydrogenase [Syntrophorhabdales bacterium]